MDTGKAVFAVAALVLWFIYWSLLLASAMGRRTPSVFFLRRPAGADRREGRGVVAFTLALCAFPLLALARATFFYGLDVGPLAVVLGGWALVVVWVLYLARTNRS